MSVVAIPEEHRQFLADHRLCVIGTGRPAGAPALSPVFYLFEDDEIVVSITTDRHKYRAISRDPNVSACVLHEEFPFSYVTVYGQGRIETDGAFAAMAGVTQMMLGRPLTTEEHQRIEQRVVDEHRVVLRIAPDRVIGLGPPRPKPGSRQPGAVARPISPSRTGPSADRRRS